MPSISLTLPVAGTVITAGLHATNYTSLQTLLNGGLDTANWASGKIFPPSKFTQEGASNGQVLAWNGSIWAPATQSSSPGYAITLPGSPSDGQEAILVDSVTLPTYQWRFRWNAGSSNADKWEYIGGGHALVEVLTYQTTTSLTYAALATAGPSFALPRAGVYVVELGYTGDRNAGGGGSLMSYDIGGTGAVDGDAVENQFQTAAITGSAARTALKTGLTAVTLTAKYRGTNAATYGFSKRWLRVTPVRVS